MDPVLETVDQSIQDEAATEQDEAATEQDEVATEQDEAATEQDEEIFKSNDQQNPTIATLFWSLLCTDVNKLYKLI